MKRLVAILMTLVLLLPVMAAMAEEEPIVLTTSRAMDSTLNFDESDPEKRSFTENRWINKLLEELNVKLEYKWIATDSDSSSTKWSAAMASGDLPDFASVSDSVYKLLVEMDAVMDCTDIWNNCVSEEYKALLGQNAVSQMTYDGELLGMPWPSKGYNGANLLYVRQDWLDKLNLEYPKSWQDIVNVARAFKEAKMGGEDTIGLMVGYTGQGDISGVMNVFNAQRGYWVERDGELVWSNIQPEMRTALLELQKLYAEGLINSDVCVVTEDVAREYVSTGKTGMFFGVAWTPTQVLSTLYNNDPEANIVISTIKDVNGDPIAFQTNTPVAGKIFVNKNCKHPEKIAEMLNLVNSLLNSSDSDVVHAYSWSEDGFPFVKFNPFADTPTTVLGDLAVANEIRLALEAGAETSADYPFTYADAISWYDPTVAAKKGEGARGDQWWYLTLGEQGTFTLLYDAYQEGLHLDNGYVGMPTETQELMGDIINDQLVVAMQEVIMGADISVYDQACESWLANGGQTITDEVNEASGR